MYNLEEGQIKEENLKKNDAFLEDASEFLRVRTGSFLTEPDEIYDAYINHMRWHSTNDVTPFRDLRFAQDAEPDMQDRMARLFQTFDVMETSANDDIASGAQAVLDYGGSILASPSTWTSLLTAGAGKIAALGAQKAARVGVRGLLYKLTEASAKNPIKSGAIAGGTVEGSAAFATEKARQKARVETGVQEEEDTSTVALNTLIGTLAGSAGGGLTGFYKGKQAESAKNLLDNANKAHKVKEDAAVKEADKTISANNNLLKRVLERLRPLNEKMVQDGKEINESMLSANELLLRTMDNPTKKSITAAAIELLGPEDLAKDPTKRITEIVADRIRSGDLTTDKLDKIAGKYNLSQEQLGLVFTADISDAARSLQLVGQIKKTINKDISNLVEDIQKLTDKKTGRGISISDQQMDEISSLSKGFNLFVDESTGLARGFERMRRSFLTSQIQTVVRNFAGGGARVVLDLPERLLEQTFKKIANTVLPKAKDGAKRYEDDLIIDSISISKYLNPVGMDESRIMADVVSQMYARSNPVSAQRLFGTFIDGGEVARKGRLGGALESLGAAVNFGNRFSDNYYKKAIFSGHLDRLVQNRLGKSLLQVLEDGEFSKITKDMFAEATDKSFELLYQKTPKGKLGKLYLEFDKMAGSGAVMGMLIPFPRFVMNQMEFMYDHAPIIGLLSSKSAPEKLAKQITGTSMVAYGMHFSAQQGTDRQWYNYVNENGETTDLRPFLGPLSMPMYLGHLLNKYYDSDKPTADNVKTLVENVSAKQIAELMLGSALRVGAGAYFAETALPELAGWVTGLAEDSNFQSNQKFNRTMARFFGDYVSTLNYNMPTAIARDIYKINSKEARLLGSNEYVTFGDMFRARASRALPEPLKQKVMAGTEKRPVVKQRFSVTSEKPMQTLDPFSTAVTGLTRSPAPTRLEKELAEINLTSYDLYKPIPFGPANALVARELSGNSMNENPSLSEYLSTLLDRTDYQNATQTEKRNMLRYAARQYIGQLRDDAFDVLQKMSKQNKIDYSVAEIRRQEFESRPKEQRDSALILFRRQKDRRPDLSNEKDLKLLTEMAKEYNKQFGQYTIE